MEVNHIIADNLRQLRTARNLSLGQLADLSGISKVMLSQIEKGSSNPTINTIWKIAAGLHVPYTALLEDQRPKAQILSKANLSPQENEDGHYRIYCYYPSAPNRIFEWFQIELDAGHHYTSIGHPPGAQEYIIVYEGLLTVEVNGNVYHLGPEDSINFSATSRHVYDNQGTHLVKASVLNYYPV